MKLSRLVALVAAAPLLVLAACTAPIGVATNATDAPAQATAAVERAGAAYARIKPIVDVVVLALPSPYAERVARAQTTVEQALAFARLATTAAEQLYELRRVEAAMREIETFTSPAAAKAPAG